MSSLNRAQIIGYVTQDPEIRELANNTLVTDLNIEIKTLPYKADGNAPMISSFITVTLWRWLAEFSKNYIKKGTQVYISGRLETDSWEDDQGNKKYKTKMVGDNVILTSPKDGFLPALSSETALSGGINKVEVLGNITQDIELKTTANGNNVCSFGLATNRVWKNNEGEKQEKVEFHNIVVWGDLALDLSKNVSKGKKIYVAGRIQTRNWETPDGQKRTTTEVVADEVKSLGHALEDSRAFSSDSNLSSSKTPEKKSAGSAIPEVNYESDIKPEDLPF
jgi:single-strand DNA-binding protein